MTFKDFEKKASKGVQDAKEKASNVKDKFDQGKTQVNQNASNMKNAHKQTDDERIDQAGRESFPASDPAGYRSKQPQENEKGSRHV